MNKWKVTFLDFNLQVVAKIIGCYDDSNYGLINDIASTGINTTNIIKIEKVMEANDKEIEDLTQD